ncbi:MAG: alpha/beta hydrolase fold domain-containing protein [Clostridia bacterium]|nr:alpha/beta hydrolase fold domain-containing protein [Clostridia bacterium]
MASKKAEIISRALKMIKLKETVDFVHPKRTKKPYFPSWYFKNYQVNLMTVLQKNVYTISKNRKNSHHIVFFHGGGYSLGPTLIQYRFIKKIISTTKSTLSYVHYPLAPEACAEETLSMAAKTYEKLTHDYPDDKFSLMGVSAGGGLALALALKIKDMALKPPVKIVLFSPWLDIELMNPAISAYEYRDVVLKTSSLKDIGIIYARGVDLHDPMVSPLFGDLNDLGEMAVFYGTDEIFYPDCKALCRKSNLSDTSIKEYVYEGMPHAFIILPIAESNNAIKEAALFLMDEN